MDYPELSQTFKSFCDERRLMILDQLRDGEKCACKLLESLDISQPTLSHHMKILTENKLVIGRKEGKWIHYSLNPEAMNGALVALARLTDVAYDTKASCQCGGKCS